MHEDKDSDSYSTLRDPKCSHLSAKALESDNGLEEFGCLVEEAEASRLSFEERRLERKERIQQGIIKVHHCECEERRGELTRRNRREMERMKVFLKFAMKAFLTAVKDETKKDYERSTKDVQHFPAHNTDLSAGVLIIDPYLRRAVIYYCRVGGRHSKYWMIWLGFRQFLKLVGSVYAR